MAPRFTIIIPVYNVVPYLRECLDSVKAQTFIDWEAICVDDGSTDNSGLILDEYAAKDTRFKVVHKVNGGVASARNTGLDVASGEWIAFLDADDVWAPWTLAFSMQATRESVGIDVVRFDTGKFVDGQSPWRNCGKPKFEGQKEDVSKHMDYKTSTCFFGGKIYRKDVIDGIRFRNYKIGEDLLFLTQCMVKVRQQYNVMVVCYWYRQRTSSVSHSAVTLRSQRDCIGYLCAVLMEYAQCGKVVSKSLYRTSLNRLVEQFAFDQRNVPKLERYLVWQEWRAGLRKILNIKEIGCFQRIRMLIVLAFPYYVITYLLCVVPYTLKCRGVHR